MAIADNRVVTFKDLYGVNGAYPFEDVSTFWIGCKGIVVGATTDTSNTVPKYIFSESQFSKRLKYIYYGYALVPTPLQAMVDYNTYSLPKKVYYKSGTNDMTTVPMIPTAHLGDTTFYEAVESWDYVLFMVGGSWSEIKNQNAIKYSSIASMSLRDNTVTDVWTEYKPVAKIDPSTGEVMTDSSTGNILYETDEEGNILYEEVESYYEQREADAPITID